MFTKTDISQYGHSGKLLVISEPSSIEEVEEMIRKAMSVNRCLTICANNRSGTNMNFDNLFKWLHKLSVIYEPWQFRTLHQEDGSFDVSWTEIDSWLHKYGWISFDKWRFRRTISEHSTAYRLRMSRQKKGTK